MIKSEREKLLQNRSGTLKNYNLWEFWDGIPTENKDRILDYFETTPFLLFDYKTLFKGDSVNDIYHGAISELQTLLVIKELELADYFFLKFCEYNSTNYNQGSMWGGSWENRKLEGIKIWEHILNRTEENDLEFNKEKLEKKKSLTIEDVYWSNAHFFIYDYSKIVYQSFLKGKCDIERFKRAVEFSICNIDRIKLAITNIFGWDKPLRNGILDQYLIYLEKQKQYRKCVELILQLKDKGWRNDFVIRLNRCLSKLEKNI